MLKKINQLLINLKYDYKNQIRKKKEIYEIKDLEKINEIQLFKLNQVWQLSTQNFNFYKEYQKKNNLPKVIDSIEVFGNFPTISKTDIKNNFKSIFKDSKSKKTTLTGGTSGLSTKFPTSIIDSKFNFINSYYLRNKFQISTNDKYCYIWGHSHKFGNNFFKKKYNSMNKNIKNFFMNRKQFSAYDLNENNLKKITKYLFLKKPKILFGYGSTLSILSKYMSSKSLYYEYPIKIISTSENIDYQHQILLKKQFENCELINEFGMAETGVIGYNIKTDFDYIETLWDSFLIQTSDYNLTLTDLNLRTFPLIRYKPDDLLNIKSSQSIFTFKIKGKERPYFLFKNHTTEKKLSLIFLDHLFKNEAEIYTFQYLIKNEKLHIYLHTIISNENLINFKRKIDDYLKFKATNYVLEIISKPYKSIAGKLL